MGRFDGKVSVVTGSAGGIGEQYVRSLADEGALVVVADINLDGAQRVADDIVDAGGIALGCEVDVSQPDSAADLASTVMDAFGRVDHLVNNAAIYGGMELDLLLTVDWEYYRRFMSVNLDGALVCTRAFHEHLAADGGGAIVNQSSTAAWLYSGFYGLAKVGINGLTQQLAVELGGSNVRVNAIAPGPTDTEATRGTVPPSMVDDIVSHLPLRRMGTPVDMAAMLLFLLSDDAAWITGQIFNVDGGQIIRS